MTEKARALDVFDLISKIDQKNYDLWSGLTEEQKKEFSPLITMRWMAGVDDPFQVIMLNELVNRIVFSLPDHKELMLKLLTVCSNGKRKRCQWVPYKVTKGSIKKNPVVELIAHENQISIDDAEDLVVFYTHDEIIELAEKHGLQKEEVKALKKELK